jgi:hypothetical protein
VTFYTLLFHSFSKLLRNTLYVVSSTHKKALLLVRMLGWLRVR